jgi:hypothetical protein
LLFTLALEYAIRKFQENQVVLKLNRTHYLLVNVGDVNMAGNNKNNKEKNTKFLMDVYKKIGLEVYAEKTTYMQMSHHYNAGHNHNTRAFQI